MTNAGDFAVGATVRLPWSTNAAAGGAITRATDGSIRIYKNSTDTQRSSAAGITDTEDFDTITGTHLLTIDTSDNTDAGFYGAGNDYLVMLVGAVIDGATVNVWLGLFSIQNRYATVSLDAAEIRSALGLGSANLDTQLADLPTVAELATSQAAADDATLSAIAALAAAPSAATVASAVRTELATELARVDADVSSRASQTSVDDLPTTAELATSQAGADDATLSAIAALPSAATVASAVRTELATELARVDVGVGTRASQTSVDDLPTNAELATSQAGADDATLSAIAAIPAAPSAATVASAVRTELATELGRVDAAITTRASQASVDDLPTNSELATSQASADDATLAAIAALLNLSSAQVRTQIDAALDAALADSIPAVGNMPSLRQAMYMSLQFQLAKAVVGTLVTIDKPSGAVLMTLTTNSATVPTTIERTT